MAEKRAQVPWQILLGALAGVAVTVYAIVVACRAVDGVSSKMTASVALAIVLLPTVTIIAAIALFAATAWKSGDRSDE